MIPYSHISRVREAGRELATIEEQSHPDFDESQVLKVSMPRGSCLLFTGGLIHGAGTNTTAVPRRTVLTGYQLGWLKPENKWFAHQGLHAALSAGEFGDEMAELLGHVDRSTAREGWLGTRRDDAEGMPLSYHGRSAAQVAEEGEEMRLRFSGGAAYEACPTG